MNMFKIVVGSVVSIIGTELKLPVYAEQIPLPREIEILTIAPRLVTHPVDAPDPEWLTRGGVRPTGTYDNPLGTEPFKVNPRQMKLLRALDNLKLFEPEDDLDSDNWPHLWKKYIEPETLTVPPRVK